MPTPEEVLQTFQKRLRTNIDLYREMLLAVHGKKRKESLESMLAEQSLLGVSVLWEAFIHDLMVAYIEQSPSACLSFHKGKITQSIESKSKVFARWTTITLPSKVTKPQIEAIVDPDGYNITADSAESLSNRANQLLSAPHARKFSLEAADRAVINLLIALRNNLSHRSSGSLSILKLKLSELAAQNPASALNGTITTTGSYLKSRLPTLDQTRAEHFGETIYILAAKLI